MWKFIISVQFIVVLQLIVGCKLFNLIYVALLEKKHFNMIITVWYSLVLACSVSQDHLNNIVNRNSSKTSFFQGVCFYMGAMFVYQLEKEQEINLN